MSTLNRATIEAALDSGQLETRIKIKGKEDRWYKCRRNGRTQTWKRDPDRWEIPIKYGFRDCARIRSKDMPLVPHWFRVSEDTP